MTEPSSSAEPVLPQAAPAETEAAKPSPPVLWPVLRTLLSLLRHHGLRMLLLALVMSLVTLLLTLVLMPFKALCDLLGVPQWVWSGPAYYLLVGALLAAAIGPMEGSYQVAVHRLLCGEKAGLRALFRGYGSRRLFIHLALASAVLVVAQETLNWLWSYLPWDFCWDYFANIVTPGSPLDNFIGSIPGIGWLISEFHWAAKALILLPLQWALLEVAVGGKSWLKGLAGSARLAWQHKRVALIMLGVLAVVSLDVWLRALLPRELDYLEGYSRSTYTLVYWLNFCGNAVITLVKWAVKAAALVVVYQAMLSRPPEPSRARERLIPVGP